MMALIRTAARVYSLVFILKNMFFKKNVTVFQYNWVFLFYTFYFIHQEAIVWEGLDRFHQANRGTFLPKWNLELAHERLRKAVNFFPVQLNFTFDFQQC